MLRGAYFPYQYLRRIQEYEAIGVERDLAGLPVAWVPNEWLTSSEPEVTMAVNKMTQMVKDVRRNEREGLVLPMMYEPDLTGAMSHNKALDFELLSSGGSRQFDTDKIITRYNQQVAMSLLGDFVTLGHDGVGSYALGAVKMVGLSIIAGRGVEGAEAGANLARGTDQANQTLVGGHADLTDGLFIQALGGH